MYVSVHCLAYKYIRPYSTDSLWVHTGDQATEFVEGHLRHLCANMSSDEMLAVGAYAASQQRQAEK